MNATDWEREAMRLHDRYVREIVEACGFCPWAERAREEGRTRVAVVLDDDIVPASLEWMATWAAEEDVEVAFLLFPRFEHPRDVFSSRVSAMRAADAGSRPSGTPTPFALAAFHPDADAAVARGLPSDPERLIVSLRRTPDPCVQLVRMASLERLRSGAAEGTHLVGAADIEALLSAAPPTPPLRARIARANLENVRKMGLASLDQRLADIRRDRDATYAAFSAREPG